MSEFNDHNWKEALISVYNRSLIDPAYRNLCLTDALAAIKAVSDIELPDYFKCQFFPDKKSVVYAFLLPPVPAPTAASDEHVNQAIRWSVMCTVPTNGV